MTRTHTPIIKNNRPLMNTLFGLLAVILSGLEVGELTIITLELLLLATRVVVGGIEDVSDTITI